MKRLLSIMLVMAMAFSLAACGGQSEPSAAAEEVAASEVIEEPTEEEVYESTSSDYAEEEYVAESEELETTPEPEPDTEPEDELAVLSVLDPLGGASDGSEFFIKRGEKYYTLGSFITEEMANVNYAGKGVKDSGKKRFFYYTQHDGNTTTKISIGDIPVPTLQGGDLVMGVSSFEVPKLKLTKIDFYGFTVGINHDTKQSDLRIWNFAGPDEYLDVDYKYFYHNDTIAVLDNSGNEVDDRHDLVKDNIYLITWYEGTTYREVEAVADSLYYIVEDESFTVEGDLTKEGYVEYDLSGIPTGLYETPRGGILRIE